MEGRRIIAGLEKLRTYSAWVSTRVGTPGCAVRREAGDDILVLDAAIAAIKADLPDIPEETADAESRRQACEAE